MPPWGATKEMRGREARVESFSRMIPTEWVEAEREKEVGVLERVSRPAQAFASARARKEAQAPSAEQAPLTAQAPLPERAPVPAPPRALALDALRLLRQLRDPDRRPARWSEPAFTREIELVRLHLEPLRSRKALANSFGREAFHMTPDEPNRDDPGAVRVAYALRWLELGDGAKGQSWPALLKSPPA